jgi:hypothetical protein
MSLQDAVDGRRRTTERREVGKRGRHDLQPQLPGVTDIFALLRLRVGMLDGRRCRHSKCLLVVRAQAVEEAPTDDDRLCLREQRHVCSEVGADGLVVVVFDWVGGAFDAAEPAAAKREESLQGVEVRHRLCRARGRRAPLVGDVTTRMRAPRKVGRSERPVPERPAQLPRDEPEADEADAPEVRKHLLADRAGDGASQQPVIGDEEWRLQCAKTRHAVALPCPRGEVSDLDLAASQVADEPQLVVRVCARVWIRGLDEPDVPACPSLALLDEVSRRPRRGRPASASSGSSSVRPRRPPSSSPTHRSTGGEGRNDHRPGDEQYWLITGRRASTGARCRSLGIRSRRRRRP